MESSIFFYKKNLKSLIRELLSTNDNDEKINLIKEIRLIREVLNNLEEYYLMQQNYEYFMCSDKNDYIY